MQPLHTMCKAARLHVLALLQAVDQQSIVPAGAGCSVLQQLLGARGA
jgi:hypothetical protein